MILEMKLYVPKSEYDGMVLRMKWKEVSKNKDECMVLWIKRNVSKSKHKGIDSMNEKKRIQVEFHRNEKERMVKDIAYS